MANKLRIILVCFAGLCMVPVIWEAARMICLWNENNRCDRYQAGARSGRFQGEAMLFSCANPWEVAVEASGGA